MLRLGETRLLRVHILLILRASRLALPTTAAAPPTAACSSSLTTPPKIGRPDFVTNSLIISQISYSRNVFDQDLTRIAVLSCFIYIKFHRHVIQKHKIVYVANLQTNCYVSLVCIYLNKESFRDESVWLKFIHIRILNSLLQ